ncbi:hypothetical protein EVAR_68692_1 [Eumeta japonica]|uniref:Uncharacterized protein n=1 Tax=Eumeta variegata TaxID=151549 RepID=A0A4C2A492_EUMVA|nr:hypothetical protein EVAR_68692_1 [Eumeta japonica]
MRNKVDLASARGRRPGVASSHFRPAGHRLIAHPLRADRAKTVDRAIPDTPACSRTCTRTDRCTTSDCRGGAVTSAVRGRRGGSFHGVFTVYRLKLLMGAVNAASDGSLRTREAAALRNPFYCAVTSYFVADRRAPTRRMFRLRPTFALKARTVNLLRSPREKFILLCALERWYKSRFTRVRRHLTGVLLF